MDRNNKSLENQGEVGGPEEDRTPDLLIAKDATVRNINGLDSAAVALNSGISGGVGTNRAQSARAARRVYRGMWLVMSLLIMGATGLAVGGVVILAHGHWWALGPLALLGAVVWGTWRLTRMYDRPEPADKAGGGL